MTVNDRGENTEGKDPWIVTHWVENNVLIVHMTPRAGPPHDFAPGCWCQPMVEDETNERDGRSLTYVHRRVS